MVAVRCFLDQLGQVVTFF